MKTTKLMGSENEITITITIKGGRDVTCRRDEAGNWYAVGIETRPQGYRHLRDLRMKLDAKQFTPRHAPPLTAIERAELEASRG